jgi:poly(A) polymerase
MAKLRSPIDGNDLMALFDRAPGPWLKPIKEHLLNLVIEGELAEDDRESAERIARQLYEEQFAGAQSPVPSAE